MRTLRYYFAAFLTVIAIFTISWLTSADDESHVPEALGSANEDAARTDARTLAQPNLPHVAPPSNDASNYRFSFHNEFGQSDEGDGGFLIALEGDATLALVKEEAGERTLEVALRDVVPMVDSVDRNWVEPEESAQLRAALQVPFYVTFDRTGRIVALANTTYPDAMIANLQRTFASSLQLVRPEHAMGTWQTTEFHTSGEVESSYESQPDGAFLKTSQKLRTITTPDGQVSQSTNGLHVAINATSRMTFDPSETTPISIELEEALSTEIMDATLKNHIELRWTFVNKVSSSEARARFRNRKIMRQDLTRTPASINIDPQAHLRAIAKDATASSILASLDALESKDGIAVRQKLEQMEAVITLRPSEASELKSAALTGDDTAASLALSALGNVGDPSSQRVLTEVLEHHDLSDDRRHTALALLGLVEEPTEETVRAMQSSARRVDDATSSTATLGLGNLAHALSDSVPEKASALVQDLEQALAKAETDESRAHLLRALGNTGHARLLDVVPPYLNSSTAVVRQAAVFALRFLSDVQALALMGEAALGDESPPVRAEAVRALTFGHAVEALNVFTQVALTDSSTEVRLEAVGALIQIGGARTRETLRRIAESESDPVVRRTAEEALGHVG